jgi:hypothetical protein
MGVVTPGGMGRTGAFGLAKFMLFSEAPEALRCMAPRMVSVA